MQSPFEEEIRHVNPLARVPALTIEGGPTLVETMLICRTLMAHAGVDLLPQDQAERIQAEADVALLHGALELGIAFFLESNRDPAEQSAHWQSRRKTGIMAAMPEIARIAARAEANPEGFVALDLACVLDWFSFRLGDHIDWRAAAPEAARVVDGLLHKKELADTDPRAA